MEIEYDLRNKVFNKLISYSPTFYSKFTTGDLMARMTNDLRAVRMMVGPGTFFSVDIILMSVPSIILLLLMNWKLTLIALLPAPLVLVFAIFFMKWIHIFFEKVQEQFSTLSEKVRENVSGIRIVKSYNQEKEETENFSKESRNYFSRYMRLIKLDAFFEPVIYFLATTSFIIVLILGGKLIINNKLTIGEFWAFNEYLMYLIWPMIGIGWILSLIQRGTASMKRILKILDYNEPIQEVQTPIKLEADKIEIEFKNVWFRFNENTDWVLKNINFKIPDGKMVSFFGKVGSGKSMLVNLLLRFYDVTRGEILINRNNIKNLSLKEYRNLIGLVPQEVFLFSNTIKHNIVFGIRNYKEEDIIQACSTSEILNNIMEFANQFDTVIGEKGVTLSGGQRQRTAISRAIIKNPSLILFDDAFSSIDTETESKIIMNLRKEFEGKTGIIISHRISTIKDLDYIYVIDNGEIIQQGKHNLLIGEVGIYKNIFEQQKLEQALKES
jgi:ATP-binding cassette subfamily B protein